LDLDLPPQTWIFMLDRSTSTDIRGARRLGTGLVRPLLDEMGDVDTADHHRDREKELNGFRQRPEVEREILDVHVSTSNRNRLTLT
jgi:hypothetical protein